MREIEGIVNSGKALLEFPFENKKDDKITIRSFDISDTDLKNSGGGALRNVSYFDKVKPHESKIFSLSFDIDTTLKPGKYSGMLSYQKDFRTPFVIYIPESFDLEIVPEELVLVGGPSDEINKEIYIRNKGNISIDLPTEFSVILSETGEINRALGASITNSSKKGFNNMLDGFVSKLSDSMVKPMNVKLNGKNELLPGKNLTCLLKFNLPPNIKYNRNYSGILNIFNSTLNIILYCKLKTKMKNGTKRKQNK